MYSAGVVGWPFGWLGGRTGVGVEESNVLVFVCSYNDG